MGDLDKTLSALLNTGLTFCSGRLDPKKAPDLGAFWKTKASSKRRTLCVGQGKVTAMLFFFPFFFPLLVTRPVNGKLCLGPAPSASQLCNLPCPSECVVSAWSVWGPCLHENCHDRRGGRGNGCSYILLLEHWGI